MKLLSLSLCILLFTVVGTSGQQAAQVTPSSKINAPITEAIEPQGVSIQEVCAIRNGYPIGCQACLGVEAAACPDGQSIVYGYDLGDEKTIRFVADIRGELPPGAYVRWRVDGGTIIENQEEDSITVQTQPDGVKRDVEAVVEIAGMPDEAFNIPAAPAKKKEVLERCPDISIESPEAIKGNIEPGVPFTYKAKVDGVLSRDSRLEWTVSTGTIIEGQGTLSIKVFLSEKEFVEAAADNFVITLSSKIPSTGNNCDQIVTDSITIEPPPPTTLIDEFSASLTEINEGRLAAAAIEQRNNPDNRLYIIEYFPPGTSDFDIREKMRVTYKFLLTEEGLPKGNVTVVSAFADELNTKIFRIPRGGQTPKP